MGGLKKFMKKILEYYQGAMLAPTGGARGYLYGLRKGLEEADLECFRIDYLPGEASITKLREYSKNSQNFIIKCGLRIYRRVKHIRKVFSILSVKTKPRVNINEYDAVHFHSASDMYRVRDVLKQYSGKVLFTSHSPQPQADEYIESSSKLEMLLFGKYYKKLVEVDKYAFNRADYIIFPCEDAEEPYFTYWPEYSEIKQKRHDRYKYLLTGTFPAKVVTSREKIREKYNIPESAFVITYVGRHNEIKGYNNLKEIGKRILSKHKDVYFLIAGNLGPIKELNHERWIEVGWTNEPHSFTAAGDLFVLPNKETYFDLVLLEVLSVGTPVLAANTGGNKYFKDFFGVQLYNNVDEGVKYVEQIMMYSKNEIQAIFEMNKKLFNSKFTPKVFAENYINLLKNCDI